MIRSKPLARRSLSLALALFLLFSIMAVPSIASAQGDSPNQAELEIVSVVRLSNSSAYVTFTAGKAGVCYAAELPHDAPAPTAEEIKATWSHRLQLWDAGTAGLRYTQWRGSIPKGAILYLVLEDSDGLFSNVAAAVIPDEPAYQTEPPSISDPVCFWRDEYNLLVYFAAENLGNIYYMALSPEDPAPTAAEIVSDGLWGSEVWPGSYYQSIYPRDPEAGQVIYIAAVNNAGVSNVLNVTIPDRLILAPPTLYNGRSSRGSPGSAHVGFNSDMPGTYRYVVREYGDEEPSEDYIMANGTSGYIGWSLNGEFTANIWLTGLDAAAKDVYIVAENKAGRGGMLVVTIDELEVPVIKVTRNERLSENGAVVSFACSLTFMRDYYYMVRDYDPGFNPSPELVKEEGERVDSGIYGTIVLDNLVKDDKKTVYIVAESWQGMLSDVAAVAIPEEFALRAPSSVLPTGIKYEREGEAVLTFFSDNFGRYHYSVREAHDVPPTEEELLETSGGVMRYGVNTVNLSGLPDRSMAFYLMGANAAGNSGIERIILPAYTQDSPPVLSLTSASWTVLDRENYVSVWFRMDRPGDVYGLASDVPLTAQEIVDRHSHSSSFSFAHQGNGYYFHGLTGGETVYLVAKNGIGFSDVLAVELPEKPKVFTVDGMTYRVLAEDGNTGAVQVGEGLDSPAIDTAAKGHVDIPETVTYDGVAYKVTSIGGGAFDKCTGITSVTIPDSVRYIGTSAFEYCISLSSITFGSGLLGIQYYAFSGCHSLTGVTIPDGVEYISHSAFDDCVSLTSVTIPASVEYIGANVFDACRSLTSVYFDGDAPVVDEYLFREAEIAPGATAYVYSGANGFPAEGKLWYGLTVKYRENAVTPGDTFVVGGMTFRVLDADAASGAVQVGDGITDAIDPAAEGDLDIPAFVEYGGKTYTVTAIARNAFSYIGLTGVNIPDSVEFIDHLAFFGCSSLERISIGSGATVIDSWAFAYCESLTDIDVSPDNPVFSSDGGILFSKDRTLLYSFPSASGAYTIPDGVTAIGNHAFTWCKSLTSVVIPDIVTVIGNGAFYGCESLERIVIGSGVTDIESGVFEFCANLKVFEISPDNTAFSSENGALFNKDRTLLHSYPSASGAYTIPSSVTVIGGRAFTYTGLTSVVIPQGVAVIENGAFIGTNMTSVVVPASVTVIDYWAFSGCTELSEVWFNGAAPYVGEDAFSSLLPGAIAHVYCDAAGFPAEGETWHKLAVSYRHTEGAGIITTPATVSTQGVRSFYCTAAGCNKLIRTEAVPSTGDSSGTSGSGGGSAGEGTPSGPKQEETVGEEEIPLTETPWVNPYSDVTETNWYYGAVRFAAENGLMAGSGDGLFSPNTAMTRAMFVTVLYNLEDRPEVSGEIPFSDVGSGEWYSSPILWASQNSVASGYTNGAFGWNDPLTREQAVAILYNYARSKGLDVSSAADLSGYSDAGAISGWALDAVKWAVAEGIISGRTATAIVPKGTATRAETAAVFMLYIEGFLSDGHKTEISGGAPEED